MFLSIDSRLSGLDLGIIVAFVFFIVLIVHLNQKKHEDSTDAVGYLLMGRSLTLPLFVATLVSSWYGCIFSVTQIAFNDGIYSLLINGIFWYTAYIFFAIFLVKKVKSSEALTFPEFLSQHVGKKAGRITSVLIFIQMLPIAYSISIGIFIKNVFGIEFITAVILGVMIVAIYCSIGGFRAVVITDVVQFLVMFLGVILLVGFSYKTFGGMEYLRSNIPESHFNFSTTKGISYPFIWFFMAVSATLISPVFYQRCFAAKDVKTARNGILIATVFWCIFDLCTTFGALYARAYMPEADSLDAYLNYALEVLPSGFKGLFIAAILSTILSTLDSFLFISSSVLSYDLAPKEFQNSRLVRFVSIYLTSIISILLAISLKKDLENIHVFMATYIGVLITIPMMMISFFKVQISEKTYIKSLFLTLFCMGLNDIVFSGYGIPAFYIGISTSSVFLLSDALLTRWFRKNASNALI